ncbi:MAG: hypothetical protein JST89_16580 [Cyanobacteria bacterium SZAS-4]|nr:hypothetical protein [Cyanobacteria bacterium SZAS-4]
MTLAIAKADLKKPAKNKQQQNGGAEFDEHDEEEDESEGTKLDLIQLVHDDNQKVAELFFQFSQAEEDEEKKELFDKIMMGLKVHAQLVEELYYPLLPETATEEDKEEAEELVFEAEASNYVVSMILDVLATMKPSDHYFAGKMSVLHCLAKEQVKREEKEMFEKLKAAESEIDFEEFGSNAVERQMELQEEFAAQGKRLKGRAKSAKSVKGAKAQAKKSLTKASAKSTAKKKSSPKPKSAAKSKAKATPKARAGAQSKKAAGKDKSGVKSKTGAKAKTAGRATAKSGKKPVGKAVSKKASKRGK